MAESSWPALESLLQRISGLSRAIGRTESLRDDLGLDSFRLMELAVGVHELFGIDLGLLANSGEVFESVSDISKHVGASR